MEAPNSKDKKKNNGLAKTIANLREYVYSISRRFRYELDPNHGTIV